MENLIFHQANQQIASLLLLASSLVTILLLRGESVSGFKDLGKLFLFCNVLESLVRGSFVFFSNSATLNTVQAVHGVLEKGGEVSYVDFYANVWELVQRDQNVFKLAFRVANIAIAMYLVFVSFEGMVKENTAANYFKKQAEKKKRKKETAESDSDDEFEEKKTPNQNPTAITPQPPGGVLEEKKDYPSNFNAFFVALLVAHLSMIGLGLQETYGKVIMASKMDLGTFAATVQTSVPGPSGILDSLLSAILVFSAPITRESGKSNKFHILAIRFVACVFALYGSYLERQYAYKLPITRHLFFYANYIHAVVCVYGLYRSRYAKNHPRGAILVLVGLSVALFVAVYFFLMSIGFVDKIKLPVLQMLGTDFTNRTSAFGLVLIAVTLIATGHQGLMFFALLCFALYSVHSHDFK